MVRDRRGESVEEVEVGKCSVPEDRKPEAEAIEIRERRLSWAELMRRVFAVDVLECPGCGGRRKLIAVITEPEVIVAFLSCLGLPTRAPPLGPPRALDPGDLAHS